MKNSLLTTIICFLIANKIFAQNIGIGTTTPNDKLSVVNSLPGYGITHTYGSVTMGSYISNLFGNLAQKPTTLCSFSQIIVIHR